jgi:hypothetical protein
MYHISSMNTASKLGPHTHTRVHEATDVARCGVLSLLQKPLHCRDSADFVSGLFLVALGPVVSRARVLVHAQPDQPNGPNGYVRKLFCAELAWRFKIGPARAIDPREKAVPGWSLVFSFGV